MLTPEQIEVERVAFEAWARRHYDGFMYVVRKGEYVPLGIDHAYRAWLARAEIAVGEVGTTSLPPIDRCPECYDDEPGPAPTHCGHAGCDGWGCAYEPCQNEWHYKEGTPHAR